MKYTIERTDKEIIIKLPINPTSKYIQRILEQLLEARKTSEELNKPNQLNKLIN